ncbi:hypothetical protein D9619_002441 [Psilocybe cf. subviscida]|uniref:Transcription termination and cleavage factor C-terminal domain-containing protein n=1 Tax=Psilocybe cf. subviscida TaxID=2480587 RepID=A0A8H5ETU9_9AGAR|nr:hypothetical protein D9619_002441 [Psilocybe cf. subviscida]
MCHYAARNSYGKQRYGNRTAVGVTVDIEAAKGILNSQPAIAYALITLMVQMNAINVEVFQKTLAELVPTNQAEASTAAAGGTRPIATGGTPLPQTAPSAIPPHLQTQYRTNTPPSYPASLPPSSAMTPPVSQQPSIHTHTPTPPYGYGAPNGYGQPQQQGGYGGYQQTPPPQQQPTPQGGYQQPHFQQQAQYQQPHQQQQHYGQYQQQPTPQPAYPGYAQYGAGSAPAPASAPSVLPDALAGIPDEQKALIMRVLSMTPEQINMLPPADRATYIQIRTTLGVPT